MVREHLIFDGSLHAMRARQPCRTKSWGCSLTHPRAYSLAMHTGVNFASEPDLASLSALALKLSPSREFHLLAWVGLDGEEKLQLVADMTKSRAQSNVWYHLVLRSDGHSIQLFVNRKLELRMAIANQGRGASRLAPPQSAIDGDWTFGCGMHNGVQADTCSCLISEARVSEFVLQERDWIWS